MKYFTIKEIALIAILTAVVSTVEISIGSFMHAFNLHGKSIVLTTTAMIIYFTAFSITKKKRDCNYNRIYNSLYKINIWLGNV